MKKATYLWALLLGFGVLLTGCEKQEQPVSEPQNDAPFEIVITDKTQLSFTYNVTPLDKDMEYIFLSDTAENLAQKGVLNDDDIPALNFAMFEEEAELFGTSVEEHVRYYYVYTGDVADNTVNGIPPGDEFVIYAYGVEFVDGKPVATTDVVTLRDRTQEVTLVEQPLTIEVEVEGVRANIMCDPEAYDGRYFIMVEPIDSHFPQGGVTDAQLKEFATDMWYKTLSMYLQFGFGLESALNQLTVEGVYSETLSLMANTDYLVAAIAVDASGIAYAYPSICKFETSKAGLSDNIIEISVSDIKPRSVTITVTPSNDDPFITACFESSAYVGMTDDEIIDDYLAHFPPYPYGGAYSYTITGLNPQTDYFVAAFGYEGEEVTTKLFRCDFTTPEEVISDIDIELTIHGLYDLTEVAALNSSYAGYAETYAALFAYEFTTTPQASGIHYGLFSRETAEMYDDVVLHQQVLQLQFRTSFRPVNFISEYGGEYVILAVAIDAQGNPSKLFKSEPITMSYDGRGDAQEFIDLMH